MAKAMVQRPQLQLRVGDYIPRPTKGLPGQRELFLSHLKFRREPGKGFLVKINQDEHGNLTLLQSHKPGLVGFVKKLPIDWKGLRVKKVSNTSVLLEAETFFKN